MASRPNESEYRPNDDDRFVDYGPGGGWDEAEYQREQREHEEAHLSMPSTSPMDSRARIHPSAQAPSPPQMNDPRYHKPTGPNVHNNMKGLGVPPKDAHLQAPLLHMSDDSDSQDSPPPRVRYGVNQNHGRVEHQGHLRTPPGADHAGRDPKVPLLRPNQRNDQDYGPTVPPMSNQTSLRPERVYYAKHDPKPIIPFGIHELQDRSPEAPFSNTIHPNHQGYPVKPVGFGKTSGTEQQGY